ncbi:MAG: hypothetical protein ACYTEG_17960 [Planctomycetota bacterium]|jgi:hypothetical protein
MRTTLLASLVFAFAASPLLAQSDSDWERAVQNFKDDFKKKSIKFKIRAIEGLPTNDARTIEAPREKGLDAALQGGHAARQDS